jgi:transposase
MAYIRGEAREQTTMFPVALEELIPSDHMCRVIEAFVGRLDVAKLGFERAEPAETGHPGYDPRDLLKLYLYGYLQQVRSSWRLEAECQRNVLQKEWKGPVRSRLRVAGPSSPHQVCQEVYTRNGRMQIRTPS